MILNFLKKEEGQSLIDVLIGLTLVTVAVSFATILVFGGQSVLLDRENSIQARVLAGEGIDGATAAIEANWTGTADGNYGLSFASGTWQLASTSDVQGLYTRQINVHSLDANQKEVKSTVRWEASPLRLLNVELITLVTDWPDVIATGGDTGGSGLVGDWLNPRTLGSVDLGPGNSATGLDVKNKIVYLSSQASDSKKPDFFIVNASDGQNPFVVSSINTGLGLNAVDVAGSNAYVANQSITAQLQVITVSDILHPTSTASFQLPGVSGSGAIGQSIFFYNNKIYEGTKKYW